ncbi:MAG TPA: hypothetical protein VF493_12770, partial [Terriglobales bacterium]
TLIMEEENKKKFESFDDEWLTRALRARSQAAPRPGLEERILARLASDPESSPRRGWKWMPALAVAFGLLLIVLVGRQFLHQRQVPHHEQVKAVPDSGSQALPTMIPQPNQQTVASVASAPKPKFVRRRPLSAQRPVIARTKALPKLEHFHAASATRQEKLLATFLKKQGPARLGELLARTAPPEDLTIEPLKIAPIALENIPNN